MKRRTLLLLAFAALTIAGSLNHARFEQQRNAFPEQTGIDAPPATPTVNLLLGGFRGVVTDWLWLRAMILQEQGRFVEILQLSEWITALQPQFPDIWALHAWNLAYNITVLLPDGAERWRWVYHGVETLRDRAIPATAFDPRICTELGWILMHKIAGTTDEFADTYFLEWLHIYSPLLGPEGQLPTDTARRDRARVSIGLPAHILEDIELRFGPLDWRHPVTHALAWTYAGFTIHPAKPGTSMARRLFTQAHRTLLLEGRITRDQATGNLYLLPDLNRIDGLLQAYAEATAQGDTTSVPEAHRLTMERLVQILAAFGRNHDAQRVFDHIAEHFPESEAVTAGFQTLRDNPVMPSPRRIIPPPQAP